MKNLLLTLFAGCLIISHTSFSQGCIAVRHMASVTGNPNTPNSFLTKGQFQFTAGYRNLHSYKHFVGTEEQKQRVEMGTDVRNFANNLDLGLSYAVSSRLIVSLNVPMSSTDRSSLYEHYGNPAAGVVADQKNRFTTHSQGIGDMRASASYWLKDPATSKKGNIAFGVGIKAPTGNSNTKDYFHKLDKAGVEYLQYKIVDQSLQLGDGGWGFSVEAQGYQALFKNVSAYYNGFYLFSPKGINISNLSVPDQFAARVGLAYSILPKQGIVFTLGGRVEGLPAIDAIGKSEGSRRPGYIISIEPGIFWSGKVSNFSLNVPYALVRNRTKSWSDLQDPAGLKHGDAAFADYFVSATYAVRF